MREDSPIFKGVAIANRIATGQSARNAAINAATGAIVEMAVSTHVLDIVARTAADHVVALQLLQHADTPKAKAAAAEAAEALRLQLADALVTLGYLAPAPENQETPSGNAA